MVLWPSKLCVTRYAYNLMFTTDPQQPPTMLKSNLDYPYTCAKLLLKFVLGGRG